MGKLPQFSGFLKTKGKRKMKNTKTLMPLNLQFFADGASDGNDNGGNQNQNDSGNQNVNNDSSNNSNNDQNNQNNQQNNSKTFTQEQVNAMMAKEKREGKQSVLNSLGFKTEDEAKNAFNLLKALSDSQKTEEQKQEEAKNNALKEKADVEKRAVMAEAKLTCFTNGVNKDSIDDVLTIALSKVTDDKKLEDVIAEMKKENRYSSFFDGNSNDNTGGTPGNNKGGDNGDNGTNDYGKSLAERFVGGSKEKKSNFF